MTREEKSIAIENLTAQLAGTNIIYISDISGLNAEITSNLRRACFKAGIKLEVVKNTLLAKAMEASDNDYVSFNHSGYGQCDHSCVLIYKDLL